jgi:hypothetical protein
MSLAWQGAIAAVVLLFGVLTASAALRLNIRSENGAWILSLGKPVTRNITPAQTPPVDIADIEAKILKAVEEKNRLEKLEWVRTLRIEIEQSSRSMAERQHKILQVTLSDLEMRLGGQINATAKTLEDGSDRAFTNFYQVISTEREQDLATFNARLNRLAATDEVRGIQTDAILETILQVAELKLK